MNKKGQTEVFGVVVIVILAVLILGLVLFFAISGEGDKGIFKKNLQAAKMGDSILQYTPTCPQEVLKDMRKIIKDCNFQENTMICGKPCKDLISTETKNIIRSIQAKQPTIAYGITIEKSSGTLEISTCTSKTRITDNSIDPLFTMKLTLCTTT